MRIKRICRKPFARDPLSGRGGLFVSGRWHSQGRRIVYASATLALAVLEFSVQVDRALIPEDLVQIEIDVPDKIKIEKIEIKKLPRHWRRFPAPEALQLIGDAWLEEARTAVLEVPSVIIPEERNYLLNPSHPDAPRIKVVSKQDFQYDLRLLS